MSELPSKTTKIMTSGPKWLLAGGAVLAIGVGVSVADWGRGGHHFGPGMGPGGHQRGARVERLCERDPLKFEGVARAFLKADLDLKPEQNAELDKLASALVPALKELRDEVCNNFSQRAATVSTPERLERFAAVLRKAADTADKAVAPSKKFYATLDEKQKARVDEMADRRRHSRGSGMHGGQGMGGQGMPGGAGMPGNPPNAPKP